MDCYWKVEIVKIKYSPCKWNPYAAHNYTPTTKPDTEIKVVSSDTIRIDGEFYEFSPLDVQWPDISTHTSGVIQEAHREDGEWSTLMITVRRFYTQSCSGWDTGTYHDEFPEGLQCLGLMDMPKGAEGKIGVSE
jgi:hypothetical protein